MWLSVLSKQAHQLVVMQLAGAGGLLDDSEPDRTLHNMVTQNVLLEHIAALAADTCR